MVLGLPILAAAPVTLLAPAGGVLLLVFAAGILLWALGGRLLRPGLAVIGMIAGVPIGIWIGAAVAPEVPSAIFAAGGAIAGLVVASISYWLALASVTALLSGVLALLGAWTAADLGMISSVRAAERIDAATGAIVHEAPSPLSRDTLTRLWFATGIGRDAVPGTANDSAVIDASPADDGVIARTRAAIADLWDTMPPPLRTLLVASLAAGTVVGFLFGLLFADAAAKLVTSLAGSLLLLVAGMPLLSAAFGRSDDLLPLRPGAWFAALGMLTIIGFGVQRMVTPSRERSDRPSRPAA